MSSYLISVIIPVYNVEPYIAECLDSVVNQTLGIDRIEVILVDDCTPDRSMDIAGAYAERYPSIKIVKRDANGGQGLARNTGLAHATSDYVAFLDPDDFISPNTYEHALNLFAQHQCDMVIYEYEYYSPSGRHYPRNPSAALFERDQCVTDYAQTPHLIFSTSVCNKVFGPKLRPYLSFKPMTFEDVVPATLALFHAKSVCITNQCKYYYRKRENEANRSTMDHFLDRKQSYYDHLAVNEEMAELARAYPQYKEMIDWFNARSFAPFLYNMLSRHVLSLAEKREIYRRAKLWMDEMSPQVIDKLDQPLSRMVVGQAKRGGFVRFAAAVYAYKIKRRLKQPSSLWQKARKLLDIGVSLLLALPLRLLPKYRNVWLICERGTDARDNGYRFFEYLRQEHPEVNAYYLADRAHRTDYERARKAGPVVQYRSLRHKILFVLAANLISAHNGTIEPWNYRQFQRYFGWVGRKRYIFLQHGITKDDVRHILGKANTPFDLFITGAKPEHDYIVQHFGYAEHEAPYTGFARFDALHDRPPVKKQILLMPTWRQDIVQKSYALERTVEDHVFLDSEYFRKYAALLNHPSLAALLQESGYELIFYPHYEVQQYLHYFHAGTDRIKLADKASYDVQQLLMESALLITDYSSVFFDFGYMRKPVIYYQFDRERFFKAHYKPGYFDYDRHGFGPVVFQESELVAALGDAIRRNFRLDPVYAERIDRFFPLNDRNNCRRIYDAIVQMK